MSEKKDEKENRDDEENYLTPDEYSPGTSEASRIAPKRTTRPSQANERTDDIAGPSQVLPEQAEDAVEGFVSALSDESALDSTPKDRKVNISAEDMTEEFWKNELLEDAAFSKVVVRKKEPQDDEVVLRVEELGTPPPSPSPSAEHEPTSAAKQKNTERDSYIRHQLSFDIQLQKAKAFVYLIVPPDGGYGWVIVIMSFLSQVVVDGIVLGIGILLPNMAEQYEVYSSQIVLVCSVQLGMYYLSGPFASAFINKFGFRLVALFGCVLSAVALLSATFMTNLLLMILFYSVIAAFGLSMVWVSSQLINGFYFEKYRPIANGISVSGAGFGLFMMAYLNDYMVSNYNWQSATRVHAALLCIVFCLAMSYVEVKPTKIVHFEAKEESLTDTDGDGEYMFNTVYFYPKQHDTHTTAIADEIKELDQVLYEYEPNKPKRIGIFARCCRKCCPRCFRREPTLMFDPTKRYIIRSDPIEKKNLFYTGGKVDSDERHPSLPLNDSVKKMEAETSRIHYAISMIRTSKADSFIFEKKPKTYKNWFHGKVLRAVYVLFDFRLLKSKEFRVLLASAFLFPMGFNIPFVFSKARTTIAAEDKILIPAIIGISNFICRILSGFIAYKYKPYTTYICGGGIIFGGSFVLISAFYGKGEKWFQCVYAFCYGVAPAFFATLRAIIYVRYLGLDKLTNSFGLTALAMGLGVFVGTTLAGFMNEATGSYFASFVFSGVVLMLSGILKVLLPYYSYLLAKK